MGKRHKAKIVDKKRDNLGPRELIKIHLLDREGLSRCPDRILDIAKKLKPSYPLLQIGYSLHFGYFMINVVTVDEVPDYRVIFLEKNKQDITRFYTVLATQEYHLVKTVKVTAHQGKTNKQTGERAINPRVYLDGQAFYSIGVEPEDEIVVEFDYVNRRIMLYPKL